MLRRRDGGRRRGRRRHTRAARTAPRPTHLHPVQAYGDSCSFAVDRSGLDERPHDLPDDGAPWRKARAPARPQPSLRRTRSPTRSANSRTRAFSSALQRGDVQTARIALLWSQHIDPAPHSAVTPGVYTIQMRANGGVPIVEHEATHAGRVDVAHAVARDGGRADDHRLRVARRWWVRGALRALLDGQTQWTHERTWSTGARDVRRGRHRKPAWSAETRRAGSRTVRSTGDARERLRSERSTPVAVATTAIGWSATRRSWAARAMHAIAQAHGWGEKTIAQRAGDVRAADRVRVDRVADGGSDRCGACGERA